MMPAAEVLAVLSRLSAVGLTAWVDGGWGVDALLGYPSREHSDLDLVVLLPQLPQVRRIAAEAGYRTVVRDWLPTALALADDRELQLDLHPVTPTADGGGDQALPDGRSFHYPAPVRGVIDGHPVPCVDAATQVACHRGYPPAAKDRADMQQLHDRLGVEIPTDLRAT